MPREPWQIRRIQYDDLIVTPQWRNEIEDYCPDQVSGYDSETLNGKARLLTDSNRAFCHPQNFAECLKFLTRRKNRNSMGWWYNLDYDFSAILKWLDAKTVTEFIVDESMLFHDGPTIYKIKYIRKKCLSIVVNRYTFNFFDVMNFLPGGLDKNAKKYLGDKKISPPVDWKNTTIEDLYSPAMIEYCVQDSILTAQLASLLIKTCNGFGIYSQAYYSEASLAAHYFRKNCTIPKLSEISKGKALRTRLAWQAYRGGWIQTYKRGAFDQVTVYDINSAYPAQIAALPDLTRGRFVYQHGDKEPPPDAKMGWMDCYIITDLYGKDGAEKDPYGAHYFNPVATYIPGKSMNYYFRGVIRSTITMLEYDALKHYYQIIPLQSYYWIPEKEIKYIYKDVINKLYELKSTYKNGDQNFYHLTKILMNGFYGKLIQKIKTVKNGNVKWKTGQLFNPFHGSYVTAYCRVKVFQYIQKYVNPESVIGIMTDSVATSEPPFCRSKEDFGKGLGQWSLDKQGPAVFLGSGMYTVKKPGGGFTTAGRGFHGINKLNFFELLKENFLSDEIKLPQTVRLTYKEALRLKKYDKFNIIENGIKALNVNMDKKRFWKNNFVTCGDALQMVVESEPFYANMEG